MATTVSPNKYTVGETVRLTDTVRVAGALTDPTALSLTVKTPAGVSTTYTYAGTTVTKGSTGVFYRDVVMNQVGWWSWDFTATGTGAGVSQRRAEVVASIV